MGFGNLISRVKAAFKLEKEPEIVEETTVEKLDEWLGQKQSAKHDFLKGQIAVIKDRARQEKVSANQNLEALKNAELRNPNIPEKAKHFMEGNRSAYIQKTGHFIEMFNIPDDVSAVNDFVSTFDNNVGEYGKSTARAYNILKEFFDEEASKIASNIKNMDFFASEIKKLIKESKLDELDSIKQSIDGLKAKISKKKFLLDEIGKKDERVEDLKKEKNKLLREINSLENSREHKDFQMLKTKIEEVRKEVSEKESEITGMFSALEKPMKKYARIAFNDKDLLEKYSQTPVMALSQDFGLKIVGILDNLSRAINDNTIELKDKQKPKALNEISRLDRQFLSKFVSGYAHLKKKENIIIKEMSGLEVLKKLKESKEKLSITSAMLDKAKQDLENLGGEIGKIDIEKMKKNLIEHVQESLNIKFTVS